jgi:NADPH-dependent glutamate synthase beta subunit-like oxidoreductase/NAD-dependent dihydropyrimidine dehydrogenase PreA subunit
MNLPRATWTTGTTESIKTGTWRASLPHYIKAPSPCHQACPVNGEIADWIGLARARDFRAAWDVLVRHNPFPAIAGRICHHPCESACNRGAYDDPLAICKLERMVGDIALQHRWSLPRPEVELAQHVAIVGGGPSGLSAAYQLRRRGWQVTIYEAQPRLGGLMRYGIPSYRLERSVLDAEIQRIVDMGVDVRRGYALDCAADYDRLRAGHDALYLAIGAGRAKRLPQLPQAAPWLMNGCDYLAQSTAGMPPQLGRRLVGVGGGSAAMDVARSARRAGHDVTILSLEIAQQMPAQAGEVIEALEEGITLVDGAMLTAVKLNAGGALALECIRVRLQPGAARGQFSSSPIADSEFAIDADAVVPAIGQDPDLHALAPRISNHGGLLTVDGRQSTAVEGVWAGGDVASMARFVTEAVGMGKRAAIDIDRVLRGADAGSQADPAAPVALASIATHYHARQPRVAEASRPVEERLASGIEVQLPLHLEQALAEAGRCFSCGTCVECDNCFHYCPDLAIERVEGGGYAVLTDYCKGCGICVKECPTGSMLMLEEVR